MMVPTLVIDYKFAQYRCEKILTINSIKSVNWPKFDEYHLAIYIKIIKIIEIYLIIFFVLILEIFLNESNTKMLKFACLKSCGSRLAKNHVNYEPIGYGQDAEDNFSWRHSTQVDVLDADGPIRGRHVPNFDVYAKTRTLIRQQTVSLVQHGYYNNDQVENEDTTSSRCDSCRPGCNCSFRSFTMDESTQIPSSLVTTTTFDSMETSSSSSSACQSDSDEYHSAYDPSTPASKQVYVCMSEFKSTIDGDLNMRVGDRVVLLHTPRDGNQYLLVKSLATQKCGYVLRSCLSPATQISTQPRQV